MSTNSEETYKPLPGASRSTHQSEDRSSAGSPDRSAASEQPAAEHKIEHVRKEMLDEVRNLAHRLEDPVVLGALMYRTVTERENANLMLSTIIGRLDALEARLERLETAPTPVEMPAIQARDSASRHPRPRPPLTPQPPALPLLAEVDREILAFVEQRGNVCADDVRAHFRYKGTNAAAQRLSRLFELGRLEKQQAGRKVYYRKPVLRY